MAGLFDPRPIPVYVDGVVVGEAVYWQDAWDIVRAHNRNLDPIKLYLAGHMKRVEGGWYELTTPEGAKAHDAAA